MIEFKADVPQEVLPLLKAELSKEHQATKDLFLVITSDTVIGQSLAKRNLYTSFAIEAMLEKINLALEQLSSQQGDGKHVEIRVCLNRDYYNDALLLLSGMYLHFINLSQRCTPDSEESGEVALLVKTLGDLAKALRSADVQK